MVPDEETGLEGYWRFEENTGSYAYDLSGNGNHAAISGAAWDTDAAVYYPLITLNTTAGTHTNTAPILFTASITRSVTGFTSDDITITNGEVSNFAGSGQDYSFSAVPDSEGVVTIDIAADAATDDVGNGNLAANTYTVVYDTTAPDVQISSSAYPLTQTSPIPFTLDFDEHVGGLDASDIDISHGSITDFAEGGNNYSLSFDGNDYVDLTDSYVISGVQNNFSI